MLAAGSITRISIARAKVTRTALIVGMVAAVAHASCAQAAVYKCTGADGKVAYQDAPCPANASEHALQAKAPPPPTAAAKKTPAGSHTASRSSVDAATVAKAKKAADGKVAPEGGKAKDPAAASQPAPDATKSAAPPSK